MDAIELKLPGSGDFFTQEAYKSLRTNLQFCGPDIQVIAFTSCHNNEGKSVVSLNVAKSFSDLGKRVLLIDSDMRKSVLAGRNTNAKSPKGLSEVLSGLCPLEEAVYTVKGSSLQILFAGQYPPNPVELLSSKYFKSLIQESRKVYDYIIIDTPPLGLVIDAAVIASECDGTVLIIGSGAVRRKQAQDVVKQIEKTGCKLLGIVRNNRKKNGKGYYGRYGRYGRYYTYGKELITGTK